MGVFCVDVVGLLRSINGTLAAAVCQAAADEKQPLGGGQHVLFSITSSPWFMCADRREARTSRHSSGSVMSAHRSCSMLDASP